MPNKLIINVVIIPTFRTRETPSETLVKHQYFTNASHLECGHCPLTGCELNCPNKYDSTTYGPNYYFIFLETRGMLWPDVVPTTHFVGCE